MKLLSIQKETKQTLGVKIKEGIIDIENALTAYPNEDMSANIMDIINEGTTAIKRLDEYIQMLPKEPPYVAVEEEIEWGPAVTAPNKIICVGLNYRKHADETNLPYPETPVLFSKYNNSLTGHNTDVAVPNVTQKLDYEVELGIVIGKEAKDVPKEKALDYVFGYVTANDISARDLQVTTSQWLLGKSSDGFCPIGPYLVTSDEVGNPNHLNLKTYVNGEERQNSNTADMIFYCDEIISYISKHMTLTPGDVILTGTPEGVVLGYPEEEQIYLQPGDEITVEVEKLGRLTNRFVEEK
ncbi:2-keto-4-pentenoate hydratase [Bacillus freudenreichii]|nr:2-keto-4-pentenoate hydratase [Bacillus freudenreichii]